MRKATLAGLVIMLGCALNLTLGGVAGAFMFSIGLLIVTTYELNLFTGKVGLLAVGQIQLIDLIKFLAANLIGVTLCAFILPTQSLYLYTAAQTVIQVRLNNGFWINLLRGIGCGMLVTAGVQRGSASPLLTVLSVMAFILLGFNHCIADFGYFLLGHARMDQFLAIIPTLLGNTIGGIAFTALWVDGRKSLAASRPTT